jgi:hypothetical protein
MKPVIYKNILKTLAILATLFLSLFRGLMIYTMPRTIGNNHAPIGFFVIFPIIVLAGLIAMWRWLFQRKTNQASFKIRVWRRLALTYVLLLVMGIVLPIHSVAVLQKAPAKYYYSGGVIERSDFGDMTSFGFPFRYFWRGGDCDLDYPGIDTFLPDGSVYQKGTELGCREMPNYVHWTSFLLNFIIWTLALFSIVWLIDWMRLKRRKLEGSAG